MSAGGGATITHAGETLRFTGELTRAQIAGLWRQLPKTLDGIREIDLGAVARIDSAGLALLSLLAARCGSGVVRGSPTGLEELRGAYRLASGTLAFAYGA